MPNYVYNIMYVRGLEKDVEVFVQRVNFPSQHYKPGRYERDAFGGGEGDKAIPSQVLSFRSVVPVSNRAMSMTYGAEEEGGHHQDHSGYEFEYENWGTKWGASDDEIIRGPEMTDGNYWEVVYKFTTAWNSPEKWVEAASRKFPELTFEVHSGGGVDVPDEYTFMDGDMNGTQPLHHGEDDYWNTEDEGEVEDEE